MEEEKITPIAPPQEQAPPHAEDQPVIRSTCAILLVMPLNGGPVGINPQPTKTAQRAASETDARAMCAEVIARLDAQAVVTAFNAQAAMQHEAAVRERLAGGNGKKPNVVDFMRNRFGKHGTR